MAMLNELVFTSHVLLDEAPVPNDCRPRPLLSLWLRFCRRPPSPLAGRRPPELDGELIRARTCSHVIRASNAGDWRLVFASPHAFARRPQKIHRRNFRIFTRLSQKSIGVEISERVRVRVREVRRLQYIAQCA